MPAVRSPIHGKVLGGDRQFGSACRRARIADSAPRTGRETRSCRDFRAWLAAALVGPGVGAKAPRSQSNREEDGAHSTRAGLTMGGDSVGSPEAPRWRTKADAICRRDATCTRSGCPCQDAWCSTTHILQGTGKRGYVVRKGDHGTGGKERGSYPDAG